MSSPGRLDRAAERKCHVAAVEPPEPRIGAQQRVRTDEQLGDALADDQPGRSPARSRPSAQIHAHVDAQDDGQDRIDGDCAWNTKLTITGLASRNSAKMTL